MKTVWIIIKILLVTLLSGIVVALVAGLLWGIGNPQASHGENGLGALEWAFYGFIAGSLIGFIGAVIFAYRKYSRLK